MANRGTGTAGGGRQRSPGPLRRRLIECSAHILERKGLAALTLRAAARAAGVSHMAPYRHFADKDALLAAVAETGFRALAADMGVVAAMPHAPEAKMRAIGGAYVAFALSRPALYRLMFGPTLIDRAGFPDLAAAGDAAFGRCLEAVAAARGMSPDDESVRTAAIATWALVHGLASLLIDGRITLPDDPDARLRLIDQVLESYRPAMGPPRPPEAGSA
jgi:AcrR family transcriptional regulator